MTTAENYQAVRAGSSAIACHTDKWHLPEPFAASLFSDEQMASLMVEGHTRFESIVIRSIREALSHTALDVTSPRVVLIISTTKGNIELLEVDTSAPDSSTPSPSPSLSGASSQDIYPSCAAQRIAAALGIVTEPVVVCNACISGVAAQILAQRMLDAGLYDYAIVAGGEIQSKFVVSGFQAFRAVTDEPCRPFDIERLGLNLGEGAATMIMQSSRLLSPANQADAGMPAFHTVKGAIRNDAYHLSAPHPQGEGYMQALKAVLPATLDDIATLGVHGTATMYNDQMESKAIQRAGLSNIPLTSLKGYYGHTMGAAGLIETIITMCATADGIVLPARGFEEIGVSGKVDISASQRATDKHSLIKMLSGFGGCNGAVSYTPSQPEADSSCCATPAATPAPAGLKASHTVRITPEGAWIDGQQLPTTASGKALLKEIYKTHVNDYPKFYKMDTLTRLTLVATELLIKAEGSPRLAEGDSDDSRAVILFNRSSSIVADKKYWQTVKDKDDYFPSPATFLYTLPNLTTGEVAIRNHYNGETSFYILPEKNQRMMDDIVSVSFMDTATQSVIAGWMDCSDDDTFEAEVSIISRA